MSQCQLFDTDPHRATYRSAPTPRSLPSRWDKGDDSPGNGFLDDYTGYETYISGSNAESSACFSSHHHNRPGSCSKAGRREDSSSARHLPAIALTRDIFKPFTSRSNPSTPQLDARRPISQNSNVLVPSHKGLGTSSAAFPFRAGIEKESSDSKLSVHQFTPLDQTRFSDDIEDDLQLDLECPNGDRAGIHVRSKSQAADREIDELI